MFLARIDEAVELQTERLAEQKAALEARFTRALCREAMVRQTLFRRVSVLL